MGIYVLQYKLLRRNNQIYYITKNLLRNCFKFGSVPNKEAWMTLAVIRMNASGCASAGR